MGNINTSKISNLYYEEHGSGHPLLLIAGLASDSQSWLPVTEKLSRHFRVIVFDNWGTGRSPLDNNGITISRMADDCINLIYHLGLSSVSLLGHSMGGMIAMEIAARRSNPVDKLILAATTPKISQRNAELFTDWAAYPDKGLSKRLWFRNIFYWIFSPAFFENKALLDEATRLAIDYPFPQPDSSFKNQVNAVIEFDGTGILKNINVPALIMNGEYDLLFQHSGSSDPFAAITNRNSVTIPGAAHSIHTEKPDEFTKEVVQFLNT
jgi:pimeloyl-ACP methyl ester carboxylesterase